MGFFKKKLFEEIEGGAWGHLVRDHGMTVDALTGMRCIKRQGVAGKNNARVTLMRIFSLQEINEKGLSVTGWETFDEHPELVVFEGYVTESNEARLERKRA